MAHLILALNLFAFIAGSVALAFVFVLYRQRPLAIPKLVMYVLVCLTFIVLCNGIDFYFGNFMAMDDSRVKFMTMNFLSLTILAVIALVLRLVEEVTGRKIAPFVRVLYWILSFLEYTACLGFSLFTRDGRIEPGYGYSISALYVLCWLFYAAFTLLYRLRRSGGTGGKRVRLFAVLGFLWLVLDALSELDVFNRLFGFPRIAMSPFFLIILSSCVIVRCMSLFASPRPAPPEITGDSVPGGTLQPDAKWDLSPREREVFDLLILGLENADISDRLFISPHTVKNHVSNIYRKSGAKNRLELIRTLVQSDTDGR